jgi:hypothetical protein
MPRTGIEQGRSSSGNSEHSKTRDAQCDAHPIFKSITLKFGPELAKVIEAWPSLPEEGRKAILAMVQAMQAK